MLSSPLLTPEIILDAKKFLERLGVPPPCPWPYQYAHDAILDSHEPGLAFILPLTAMLFEVNKNSRSATSGVGAKAVSASAVKHNAGRDAVFNATLNANIIKVNPLVPLTVHWDDKLLSDFTRHKSFDWLPAVATVTGTTTVWHAGNATSIIHSKLDYYYNLPKS